MCTINKSVHTKKSGNLFNDPRTTRDTHFRVLFLVGIRIRYLSPLCRGERPSPKTSEKEVLSKTLNCIWWWGSTSGDLGNVAKDIRVSEFLIRQVVHEDIHYFWYKMRKGQFLSQAMKDKMLLWFWTNSNIFSYQTFFFADEKEFLPGSEGELTDQILPSPVPIRRTDRDKN